MAQCKFCPHEEHTHPYSPYAQSSICGVQKFPDEENSEPCRCRAGKTEMFEGVQISDVGFPNSYWST